MPITHALGSAIVDVLLVFQTTVSVPVIAKPVASVAQLEPVADLTISLTAAAVTPPPAQPLMFDSTVSVLFTSAVLPAWGKAGLNVPVPLPLVQTVPADAAAPAWTLGATGTTPNATTSAELMTPTRISDVRTREQPERSTLPLPTSSLGVLKTRRLVSTDPASSCWFYASFTAVTSHSIGRTSTSDFWFCHE